MVPPDEYEGRGRQPKAWLLKKSLYGMRASPKAWQEHVTSLLQARGYLQGRHDGSVFAHPSTKLLIVLHVVDMTLSGPGAEVDRLVADLRSDLLLKVTEPLSPQNPLTFLGRQIVQKEDGSIMIVPSRGLISKLGDS